MPLGPDPDLHLYKPSTEESLRKPAMPPRWVVIARTWLARLFRRSRPL